MCDRTLEKLKQVCYTRSGEPIHELADFLREFNGAPSSCQLCIDIKDFGQAEKYIELISEHGVGDRVCVVSWIPEMLKEIHRLRPDIPLSFSHIPYRNASMAAAVGRMLLDRRLALPAAWALRTLGFELGFEMEKFLLFGDEYDKPSEHLHGADVARGYHHTHFVSGLVEGDIQQCLRASKGSVGVPAWSVDNEYVKKAHQVGIEVRVFTLDSERKVRSCIRKKGPDVIFTNNRRLIVPDDIWEKYGDGGS